MKVATIVVNNIVFEGPFEGKYKPNTEYYIHHIISEDLQDFKRISKDGFMEESVGDEVKIAYEEDKKLINDKPIVDLIIKKTEILNSKTLPWSDKMPIKQPAKEVTPAAQPLKFFKIKGRSFYAHIREPNNKGNFPSGKYQLDLAINDNIAGKLTKIGVQVKTDEKRPEMGQFVRLRATKQPRVVDENGLQVAEIPLIGNESEVTASVSTYDNREANVKAGKGGRVCLGVYELQLDNLIPYSRETISLEDIDDDTLGV